MTIHYWCPFCANYGCYRCRFARWRPTRTRGRAWPAAVPDPEIQAEYRRLKAQFERETLYGVKALRPEDV